jgi:UDP-N-acetyl-D-glucosamine dehydrogenase
MGPERHSEIMGNEMNLAKIDGNLAQKIADRTAVTGVIGLGYVGLPLGMACARGGFRTVGFDVDDSKIQELNAGRSYIEAVLGEDLKEQVKAGQFRATSDFAEMAECDVLMICVPTPLTSHREPDLSFVSQTAAVIARHLRPNQLIVLESTTYPGTTDEVVVPILEKSGLVAGRDFHLAFSPEREDPGNDHFRTTTIPKVVGGFDDASTALATAFYGAIVSKAVAVSSMRVAEAVKITENVFRAVNIALVNELKVIYDAMGIDVWEVIDAAATKPFGFMPFYPGPGLGGHCIPIDPFYLTWKAREYGLNTRFIELAGEINVAMPRYVVSRLEQELDASLGKSLGSSRVLVLGIAYKKNVPDMRESPALILMELLQRRGTQVSYHDPFVPEIPATREHARLAGTKSVPLTAEVLQNLDAILIATDHDDVDYSLLLASGRLVVDTRNVMQRKELGLEHVRKA